MAGTVLAQDAPSPLPPDQPEWEAPESLNIRSTLLVDGADSTPELDRAVSRIVWRQHSDGGIEIDAWLVHNGSERLEIAHTRAWRQGNSLVVAYRYREPDFPEEPVCACLGYSRVASVVEDFGQAPAGVVVHEGRVAFTESSAASDISR